MVTYNRTKFITKADRKRIAGNKRRAQGRLKSTRSRANARTAGFLGLELKFFDEFIVNKAIGVDQTWDVAQLDPSPQLGLSCITQGDGPSQRNGRKAILKSIYMTGQCTIVAQTARTTMPDVQVVHLALVLDTQTNGAQLNPQDVYKNPGNTARQSVYPLRNLEFIQRFKILKTATVFMPTVSAVLNAAADIRTAGIVKKFEFYSSLDIPVFYNGTTNIIANTTDNSLHLIGLTNEASVPVLISYNSRVRFTG